MLITGLAATLLIGFVGLGTDVALWQLTKNTMQGAADQAAIAAVTAYLAGGGDDPTAQAKAITASYGFTDSQNNVAVSVSQVTPSPTGYDAAYTVTITQPQTLYFSSLFLSGVTVAATGEAATTSNGPCILALGTSGQDVFLASGGSTQVNLTACDLDVNSSNSKGTEATGGACVFAQNININGGSNPAATSGSSCVSGITYSGKFKSGTTTSDPYQHRTAPTAAACPSNNTGATHDPTNSSFVSYLGTYSPTPPVLTTTAATPSGQTLTFSNTSGVAVGASVADTKTSGRIPSGTTVTAVTATTVTISNSVVSPGVASGDTIQFSPTIYPGTYCGGITLNSSSPPTTLAMKPGLYVMTNNGGTAGNFTVSSSQASVSGTGITIYLTGTNGAVFKIQGGATATLTAMTSGETAGIVFWNAGTTSSAKNQVTGGSTQAITGAVYAPSEEVDYTGGSSTGNGCTQIISDIVQFSGGSYFQHNCGGTGVSDPANSARIALIQ